MIRAKLKTILKLIVTGLISSGKAAKIIL